MLDVSATAYRDALRQILAVHVEDENRVRTLVERLSASEEEFSSEMRPGVVLPHALETDLAAPVMFLGITPDGVQFPHAAEPPHLIFVLLGSEEKRFDHLRLLTRTARLVRESEDLDELMEAREMEEVTRWFGKKVE